MTVPSLIEELQSDPLRFGIQNTYSNVTAFLIGCESAGGGMLVGFTEWLIPRAEGPNSAPWEKLVLKIALGEEALTLHSPLDLTPSQDMHARQRLFELLTDFFAFKQSLQLPLRRIFGDYTDWVRTQSWYRPDSK